MPKITIISTSFSGGGAERVAVNLANEFSKSGLEVEFLVIRNQGPNKALLSDTIKLVDLNVSRTVKSVRPLRQYIKRNDDRFYISVIRDANIALGLAAIGFNSLTLVYREANPLSNLPEARFLKFIYKMLMRYTYRKAKLVVANSDDTKQSLLDASIVASERIRVIPNPVLSEDNFESIRNPLRIPKEYAGGARIILSVGRLTRQKDFPTLIRAFAKVAEERPNVKLVIIGEGEERGYLLHLCSELKIPDRVAILPYQENLKSYFEHAEVFALTSIYEGFGNVLVEALALGLKVVATACPGGPREILMGGALGKLCTVGDELEIANALIDTLDSNPCKERQFKAIDKYRASAVSARYLDAILG